MTTSITLYSPTAFQKMIRGEEITYRFISTSAGILKLSMCSIGIFKSEFVEDSPHALMELDHVSLILVGTPFQHSVWQAALKIHAGTTITYNQLALEIGNPKACRAVARALGANNLAYLVPCHRVIGKNGSLTGFKWGLEKKRHLLQNESL